MISITKARRKERARFQKRMEYRRRQHPAGGLLFALAVVVSLFVWGPAITAAWVGTAIAALIGWLLTRRSGANSTAPKRPDSQLLPPSLLETARRRRND